MLAALDALDWRPKLVGEPVAVADLLKLIRPHTRWAGTSRSGVRAGERVVDVEGAGLPDQRCRTPVAS